MTIETIDYKGHKIEIMLDNLYQVTPNDWDNNTLLVHYHRDFDVRNDDVITEDDLSALFHGKVKKLEQQKEWHIFFTKAYIHSGVVLALIESGVVFSDERWDVSHCGAMLVSKKEARTRKQAYKIASAQIKIWNSLLAGEVYGYVIDDGTDSCSGYIGDIKDCIDEAKLVVDDIVEDERKKKITKTKSLIKNKVELNYR